MLNIAIRFCVGFIIGTAAFVVVGLLDPNTPTSTAYHPFSQDEPFFLPYRMEDLHPVGGGPMFYTDCTLDPVTRANWWHGPDSWEYATAGAVDVEGSEINCNGAGYIRLVLLYEYGFDCGDYAPACFDVFTSGTNFIHMTDAYHVHVNKGYIWYDQGPPTYAVSYASLPSDNFRKHVSAHEFGHAMSLAGVTFHHRDLDGGKCAGVDSVMTVYANLPVTTPPTFSDPICALAPNAHERCSAFLEYGYAVAPSCDADTDHCTDAVEIAHQGIKEPDSPQNRRDFPDLYIPITPINPINFDDFGRFAASYTYSFGHPNYNPQADFDESGTVNWADYMIFAPAYGVASCP